MIKNRERHLEYIPHRIDIDARIKVGYRCAAFILDQAKCNLNTCTNMYTCICMSPQSVHTVLSKYIVVKFPNFITSDGRIVTLSKCYITFKMLRAYIECFTMANDFLAMDGPAALTVPPEPLHRTDSEPAPKETRTSKPITTSPHSCIFFLMT